MNKRSFDWFLFFFALLASFSAEACYEFRMLVANGGVDKTRPVDFSSIKAAYASEADVKIPFKDELHFDQGVRETRTVPNEQTVEDFAGSIRKILEKGERERQAFLKELAPEQAGVEKALQNLPSGVSRAPIEAWLGRLRLLQPSIADLMQRRLAVTPSDSPSWKKLSYFTSLPPNAGRDLALVQDIRKDREGHLILNNSIGRPVYNQFNEQIGEVGGGTKALTRPIEPAEKEILGRLQKVSPATEAENEKRLAALRFLELNNKESHFRLMDALAKAPPGHPRLTRFTDGIKKTDWRNYEELQRLTESCTATYFAGGFIKNLSQFSRPSTPREQLSLRHLAPASQNILIERDAEDFFKWVRRVEDMDPGLYDKLLTALKRLPPAHPAVRQTAEILWDTRSLTPEVDRGLVSRVIDAARDF